MMNTRILKIFYKFLFALTFSILSISCSDILGVDPKPIKTERDIEFQITLKDNSGFMQILFGSDKVRGAEVSLKSNLLGSEYKLISDSNGVIKIKGIISDNYIITVTRKMSSDEMELIGGTTVRLVKLVNKKTRILELTAVSPANIDVEMDMVEGGSLIIISEIYACGPQGSGLYYHDKYVEVFNQSDSVQYLDKMMIAIVYTNSNTGLHYRDDPEYIHSKSIWIFPGTGKDYPIQPGQFVLCAEDAIDHRMNAPNSVDLSHADFEFYKDDAPDIDNPAIPNMIKIYQTSGNDWLIGGETGALVLSNFSADSLLPFDDQFLIPYRSVFDGVEYKADPTKLDKKILNEGIDAGSAGGIQFYTGKSMERILISDLERKILKDENNSSVDFMIINAPSPGKYH